MTDKPAAQPTPETRCPQCGTVHPLIVDLWAQVEAERKALEKAERDAIRYAMLFRDLWNRRKGIGIGVFSYTLSTPVGNGFTRLSMRETNAEIDSIQGS